MLPRLIAYLRALAGRRRIDDETSEELEFHLTHEIDANVARGLSPAEARRVALRDLGGLTQTSEAVRDVRALPWLTDLALDVRYACRGIVRDRSFCAVAVLSLALGIGANTIIFSIVDAALFRPLPYKNADRLVDLLQTARNPAGERFQIQADAGHVEDVRAITPVFDDADVFRDASPMALATGEDVRISVGAITPTFAAFLGVAPQLGRTFLPEEVPAGDRILISDAYWRRAFNRDRAVLGRTIAFSDRTCIIVGVMPPTFRYFVGAQTDAWLPLPQAARDDHMVARMRTGITLEQAQRALNAILAGSTMNWRPLGLEILPADWNRAGQYFGVGAPSTQTMLLSLLGAVGCLLAIACANVGNLLLTRTLTRQREIAVRRALGATRARIVRQFVIEGAVLAAIGAAAAAVLAWWGITALPAIVPAKLSYAVFGSWLPQLDGRALMFGCLVAIVTGVLCGAAPALRASRFAAADGLLARGRHVAGSSRREHRVRNTFLALQVAMTWLLLAGAGLLLASLVRMVTLPTGFDTANLGYANVTLPQYPRSVLLTPPPVFFDTVIARLGTVSGFRGVTSGSPPVGGGNSTPILLEGSDDASTPAAHLESFLVGSGYFQVVGIPLEEGRLFGPEDGPNSLPVAVISDNLAERVWPGRSAIGGRFRRWTTEPFLTVVGVVPHIRTVNLARDGGEAYVPAAQHRAGGPALLFRTDGDVAAANAAVRDIVRAVDPNVRVTSIGTVNDLFARIDPIGPSRFYALLLGLFAALGLVTAAIGLYGLSSYSVSRRTQEIGLRMALGADMVRVRRLMIADVLAPVATGLVIGLATASWLSRFVASQLFRVTPHDPRILAAVMLLFIAVCAAAVVVPVRRATRVDPAEALRAD
jgi:predicted permease